MQDLRTLAIFVKVAERLSFVRAAADLGITQSGVSNAISRLEDQIGTPLLARTTRRVSLTEHGAAYFERCRQALAELEEAELVLKDTQLKPSGNLRIDMPVSFGRLKMVPLARRVPGAISGHRAPRHLQQPLHRPDRRRRRRQRAARSVARFEPDRAPADRCAISIVGAPRYFAKFGQPKRLEDLAAHNCLAFTFLETRLAREWRFACAKAASKQRSRPRAT